MGRVNRSKTGMNGTKPNRTNQSPSSSWQCSGWQRNCTSDGSEPRRERDFSLHAHPPEIPGWIPRGFVRFAKSALGIERVANALAEIFSPGYLGGDSSGNSAGGLGDDDVVKGPEEVVLDAWRPKPLTKTCRLVTYYCDIMFDPKVFDELGADGVVDFIKDKIGDQEVVVDGKTVALEDLISAMTARYDSEDNVLRLVAQITFATLRTLVVAGVFG